VSVTAEIPAEINHRINGLQATLQVLNAEVRMLEGKLSNRDPALCQKLKSENAELQKRFDLLKNVLFAMISESYQPRNADEVKLQYEVLRLAAVEYFKNTKTDPELWKSIES
jgi:hypothetical protein